jgi:tetratricopeptide (TPR) repeat protein
MTQEINMVIDQAHDIDELARKGDLVGAKKLALLWTDGESENAAAWRALAYVLQLCRDLVAASLAINQAHRLAPDDVAYLFEKGVIEYKSELFDAAAASFQSCALKSVQLNSDYYLDAAKIAVGLSLLDCGDYSGARQAISGVDDEAATWVTGRLTAKQMLAAIDRKEKLTHPIRF